MNFMLSISVLLVSSFYTISCSTFKKKDTDGVLTSDIVAKDIDRDQQGSDSGNISGLSTVFFAYDSFVLSDSTKQELKENAEWIKKNSSIKRIELEGHCDSMGSEAYNIGLGLKRAQAVKSYFMSLGLLDRQFSIVSYGEERPLSNGDHSRNRRVNFVPIY